MFVFQLVNGYLVDDKITKYVETLDIYVFPVLNPDGFVYSRTSSRAMVWSRSLIRITNQTFRSVSGERTELPKTALAPDPSRRTSAASAWIWTGTTTSDFRSRAIRLTTRVPTSFRDHIRSRNQSLGTVQFLIKYCIRWLDSRWRSFRKNFRCFAGQFATSLCLLNSTDGCMPLFRCTPTDNSGSFRTTTTKERTHRISRNSYVQSRMLVKIFELRKRPPIRESFDSL